MMADKPSYEALEQRVKELEKEGVKHKKAEKALMESEEKYRLLIENQTDMIVKFDTDGRLIFVSPSYCETFNKSEEDLLGTKFMPLIHEEDREAVTKAINNAYKPPHTGYVEERAMTRDGWSWQAWLNTAVLNKEGEVESIIAVGRNINDRRRAEQALQESEAALKIQAHELKQVNTALRVLLRQRDKDKVELEEKVFLNVRELVMPHLEKLQKITLHAKQKAYLNILESNLNEIVSPFAHRLSSKYSTLTPTEMQMAFLIRDGKTTKEIADLLNLSHRTIESHRQSIRMKMGIRNRRANLRSHLLSA
jgi:PAS domain S-box-containing protein